MSESRDGPKVDEATHHRLVDTSMRFTIRYQDWITKAIADAYKAELDSGGDHRLALISAVLAGEDVSGPALGYDLGLEHVAAIASGPDRREALAAVAESLGRHLLAVTPMRCSRGVGSAGSGHSRRGSFSGSGRSFRRQAPRSRWASRFADPRASGSAIGKR